MYYIYWFKIIIKMKPYLKKIENYKIMEEIGKGSFGTVYLSKAINDATENGREIK